ncbi:DSBA oxidoreductase [Burkholderia sp. MSh2]|uniref:2-hydroxychromene-2-carboxylate isomerase n=1 Tax=Burkholderia paludis TaxID=1506587 RepID=A0A6J5DHZ3_9BURK|nr:MULTISPECIES: 2-hydroxychromene-2-carboxylate isomerase [Burkholderia]KEZ01893.1 DSBA oxidoreductase [Burkholderia sp. MSh2]KFG94756.1 DSBA oxidoreductase [Burkholderia paludis]CAB3752861.1 2-hydroxychromene-2-carboxylate isomerase [Burkholderia paludis]VWB95192.1 2-hydroxychromene-2-carboxylate isomerase [Burkholderia paludis]
MEKRIEFYFDFGSPTAYLAWTQLPAIAADHQAELVFKPVLLGAIHKATNNASPAMIPAKSAWMLEDLQRFARKYGVRYEHNPHFPINTLTLMRGATGLQMRDEALFQRYVDVIFRAMWAQPQNLGDPDTLQKVLQDGDLDYRLIAGIVQDPAVKERLKAETEAAVARGLFGTPTMFVGTQMFFGQDRLDFVRDALNFD